MLIVDRKNQKCEKHTDINLTIGIDRRAPLNRYWKCSICKKKISVLSESFFSKSKIEIKKLILLLYLWACNVSVTKVSKILDISDNSAICWFQYIRDVCSAILLATNIKLGGVGKIVQIDESAFIRAKYNRGRNSNNIFYRINLDVPSGNLDKWVFAIYDPQMKVGYMQFVPNRDHTTLLKIVSEVVLPGSIIHHDLWKAYNKLDEMHQYTHFGVNHSICFKNKLTGVHTNHVESYWSRAKRKFKYMFGTNSEIIPSYLDEFMWRERFGGQHTSNPSVTFFNLLKHIVRYQNGSFLTFKHYLYLYSYL